jgi:hypothetical protein
LTPEQKEDRVTSCQDIFAVADVDKNFFNKLIMGDETWCFACDPETKRQISEWVGETSPRPKKLKFQKSCIKTMLIIFFRLSRHSAQRIRTKRKKVNAEFYKGVMDRLPKGIQVRPAAFCSRDFDNATVQQSCKCLPMFANVCQCLPMFANICQCLPMFANV